jgi:hypothetical protein
MTASTTYVVAFVMGGIDGSYSNKMAGKGYNKADDDNRYYCFYLQRAISPLLS